MNHPVRKPGQPLFTVFTVFKYTGHCTYDLFDGAVSSSGYKAPNCRTDNEW